ncbi:hypothetical protein MHYP_G00070450 [Metynnis hypsauchen]
MPRCGDRADTLPCRTAPDPAPRSPRGRQVLGEHRLVGAGLVCDPKPPAACRLPTLSLVPQPGQGHRGTLDSPGRQIMLC